MLPGAMWQDFWNSGQRLPMIDRNGGKRWLAAHGDGIQAGPFVLGGRLVGQGLVAGSHVHWLKGRHCHSFPSL